MKLTSPLWYVAALYIALGGVMLAAAVAAGSYDPVREAAVTPVAQRFDGTGKSVAVYTDIVQPDRDVTCRATGPGKKVTDIPASTIDISVTSGSDEWHLIGLLKEGGKDQLVTCTPKDRRVDDATYAYAVVSGYASKRNTGRGIAILALTIGVGLAGFTFHARRQKRKALRTP